MSDVESVSTATTLLLSEITAKLRTTGSLVWRTIDAAAYGADAARKEVAQLAQDTAMAAVRRNAAVYADLTLRDIDSTVDMAVRRYLSDLLDADVFIGSELGTVQVGMAIIPAHVVEAAANGGFSRHMEGSPVDRLRAVLRPAATTASVDAGPTSSDRVSFEVAYNYANVDTAFMEGLKR